MIAIKTKPSDDEKAKSKFFGLADLPEVWLEGDEFSPTEILLCQINLEEISPFCGELLPKTGFLYFFMDLESSPVKGVVRYSEFVDANTLFNDGAEYDYDLLTPAVMEFSVEEKAENGLFSNEKKLLKNEVCLLKFTPDTLRGVDFLSGEQGSFCFLIDRSDLSKRFFDKAYLVNLT
ncbi:MAG: DUF1963 domain-containing protein [Clostridia bacterium]|nr:DUF1963 domain-containing protein [Clostridia bacterium]